MQEILEELSKDKIIFKSFIILDKKALGIKNRFNIYKGIDLKGNITILFSIVQRSRFVVKNIEKIQEIIIKISQQLEHNFAKVILFLDAPLCSKASKKAKDLKWRVYHDTM